MTSEEIREEFYALYNLMANSRKAEFMHAFGQVHKEMMEWFIENNPEMAVEWLNKLESIKWKNYLTQKEAEEIVESMVPEAPWTLEQWESAMTQHGFDFCEEPSYNKYALYVTMNMKMSDSGDTLAKYIDSDKLFEAVYNLAVDSLKDKDGKFNVRKYFGL